MNEELKEKIEELYNVLNNPCLDGFERAELAKIIVDEVKELNM